MTLSRRKFLIAGLTTTGGFLLGTPAPGSANKVSAENLLIETVGKNIDADNMLGYFITINRDNTVVIGNNQPEIGQGNRTTLPMLVAEELEVDFSRVSVEQMPFGLMRTADGLAWRYGGQGVGGSTGLTDNWVFMREVGARARIMLQQAAANLWEIDIAETRCENGFVLQNGSDRMISYGELAQAASSLPIPEEAPTLKPVKDFRIAGRLQPTVDAMDIVTGRTKYGIDTKIPDMKYAVMARCPYHDGEVVDFDATAALKIPDVVDVIQIDGPKPGEPYLILASGVAVITDSTWAAMKGRDALKITWTRGTFSDESSDSFDQQCQTLLKGRGQIVRDDGDFDATIASLDKVVERTYKIPFVSHAPMEPQNCYVNVQKDACYVVTPTQMPASVSRSVATASGVDRLSIEVEMTRVGGGFGRRLTTDYAAEAAFISKASGYPIQLVWSREDDMQHDFYRPSGHHKLTAGLDEKGLPRAWAHRLASASKYYRRPGMSDEKLWEAELYTDDFPANTIEHFRLEYFNAKSSVPRGSWRAPAHTANAFAIQSFIDEIAHETGQACNYGWICSGREGR